MNTKLTQATVDWMNEKLDRADLSNDVKTKCDADGKYIRTPWELCEEIVGQIVAQSPLQGKKILVVDTVEFIPVLLAFGAEKCNITYVAPYEYKGAMIAGIIGVRVVQKDLLNCAAEDFKDENKKNMKFDVVVGNPPFQAVYGKGKMSIGTMLIKKFYELVEDNGYLSMISAITFVGGGQHGLGYLFSENKTDRVYLNLNKEYFPKVGIDIGGFILSKTAAQDTSITIVNGGDIFELDVSEFIYKGETGYIPRNVTSVELPILLKILGYNKEIFDFRSSACKSATQMIGFYAGANTGIQPKALKIANSLTAIREFCDHPCPMDKIYPEDNIRSVFSGKLFHWVLDKIAKGRGPDRPANLSYFPKIDLSQRWTFDTLSEEFKLTDDEKQVVADWAASRSKIEWFDHDKQ